MTYFSLLFLCRYVDDAVGIWSHAWGSDPALGPVILQCAYDWAVDDSRSKPFIRLEFASPFVIDELIGGELAYDADDEGGQSEEGTDDEDHYDASGWEDRRRRTQRLRHRRGLQPTLPFTVEKEVWIELEQYGDVKVRA